MEDDYENTTTDENPLEESLVENKCKLVIDVKPRKIPKAIVEAQMTKLVQLKKSVHLLRLENEGLKAENQAMKRNIERYYELVLQAREKKRMKGSQNGSVYAVVTGIVLACTVHFNNTFEGEISTGRKLLFFELTKGSMIMVYAMVVVVFLVFMYIRTFKIKAVA